MCGIVHPYDKATTGNRQPPFGLRERPFWCKADPEGLTGRPSSRGPNGVVKTLPVGPAGVVPRYRNVEGGPHLWSGPNSGGTTDFYFQSKFALSLFWRTQGDFYFPQFYFKTRQPAAGERMIL